MDEAGLRALLEALPHQVWTARADGTIEFVSDRTAAYLGKSAADLVGSGWQGVLHPDDLPACMAAWGKALTSGGVLEHDARLRRADGAWVWHATTATAIRDASGAIERWVGTNVDISDRVSARELLRLEHEQFVELVDSTDGVLWEADADTLLCTFISKRVEAILGHPVSAWTADASFWADHVDPEDRARVLAETQAALRDHAPRTLEYRMTAADGRSVWIEDRITVVVRDGRPTAIRGVLFDITERREAQVVREALEQKLRDAQKMEALGVLAGGVAHDFNNILAAIRVNADLAREDAADADVVREAMSEVTLAVKRAAELVQQILTFSRKHPTELRVVDLGTVVDDVVRLLRASAPAGITFETTAEDDVPPVAGDATQLRQVVMNIGVNAWRALVDAGRLRSGGAVRVRLSQVLLGDREARALGPHVTPGRWARLTIADDGIGMDESTRLRVFDPFFTTRDVGEGTGLGLAVVHGIVTTHGGAISVESTPGAGSAFHVYLPAASEGTAPLRSSAAAPRLEAASTSGHVLFLDDEPALVRGAVRALEQRGVTVAAFTDPREAREALRSEPGAFDLVVTDYDMPHLTGVDIAKEALALRPDLPVLLLSGALTRDVEDEATRAGVKRLMQKPVGVADLRDAVHELLSPVA